MNCPAIIFCCQRHWMQHQFSTVDATVWMPLYPDMINIFHKQQCPITGRVTEIKQDLLSFLYELNVLVNSSHEATLWEYTFFSTIKKKNVTAPLRYIYKCVSSVPNLSWLSNILWLFSTKCMDKNSSIPNITLLQISLMLHM